MGRLHSIRGLHSNIAVLFAGLMAILLPRPAAAWGDEGHQVIALIAAHYLTPATRAEVTALLARDTTKLTSTTGIADEATWADKFRDSDRNAGQVHYRQTSQWHFVDIELAAPDEDSACFNHPPLPAGGAASQGPPEDCVVDKIEQFRRELHSAAAGPDERLLALQFLLHFVGDVHQPLHAADNHDRGGNDVQVEAASRPAGNLHHYWDTVFVERLGPNSNSLAQRLLAGISARQRRMWSGGSPRSWALQSFEIGKSQVYGKLPPASAAGARPLDDAYLANADTVVARQLQKAGVRLARVLNEAFAPPSARKRRMANACYPTLNMILPTCVDVSMRRCASAASANGNVA